MIEAYVGVFSLFPYRCTPENQFRLHLAVAKSFLVFGAAPVIVWSANAANSFFTFRFKSWIVREMAPCWVFFEQSRVGIDKVRGGKSRQIVTVAPLRGQTNVCRRAAATSERSHRGEPLSFNVS